MDSTPLRVCKNKRISRNKVFEGIAKLGKSTMGFFFGFKLHLPINDKGELLNFILIAGNVDDRQPLKARLQQSLYRQTLRRKGICLHSANQCPVL